MDQGTAFKDALELTFIEFIGDFGAKAQNPLAAYGGYNALAWKLTSSLKTNDLILVNSYWDGISNIMTTLLGFALGERPSAMQWVGIVLISAGLWTLKMS